ncbi:thialysine N-epsilon-acetyltransferase-like [Diadema antillarum]|uniref:thialysine N-epsilon-acetyltransferase-like n=1 Tax=Diadema antillarum TaxID=105358 RepID=UPI003A89EECC
MSSYVIRRAKKCDLGPLMRLVSELGDHEQSKATITEDVLRRDGLSGDGSRLKMYVVEYFPSCDTKEAGQQGEGSVVGFGAVHDMYNILHGPIAFLCGLYVDEDHRGKKLGKALMKAAAKDCVDCGYGSMDWDILSEDAGTKAFYTGIGARDLTDSLGRDYMRFFLPDMQKFTSDMNVISRGDAKISIEL